LRRSRSAAAGNGLRTAVKCLRGAAGIGLGTTIKYLRRATSVAANSDLGTTIKYLVNQNAGAGSNLAKAHMHKSCTRIQMNPTYIVAAFVINSKSHTRASPSVRLYVGPELARSVIQVF
jgi:hypothetical protein